MDTVYDVIIIGSGAAGLSAAVYAQRAKLNTLVIEKSMMSGGQILNTYEVDNYLGLPGINGFDLGMKMREHAEKLETKFITGEVNEVKDTEQIHLIYLADGTEYKTKAIIIATGTSNRKLGVADEERLVGHGISYCATCDGALYRKKTVAVVGGGDVAVEDAIFLARGCEKVYLIHRRNELRSAKVLSEKLMTLSNVEIIWDSIVESVDGERKVENIKIKNIKTNEEKNIEVSGVFVAVGTNPNSSIFQGIVDMNEGGYIIADETCKTSADGIFVAGDIRTKQLRQLITAASDGANAITSIEKYFNGVR